MNVAQISFQDVLQLVELVKSSANFSELRIRSGDLEIEVRRGVGGGPATADAPPAGAPSVRGAARPVETAAAPAPVPPSPIPAVVPRPSRQGTDVVTAPMVGTIYLAPEPGAAPFVRVGQQVAAGDQLCIIEVMKLMNAVTAEQAGTVTEVLAGDGEAVEFGQGLFVVAPR